MSKPTLPRPSRRVEVQGPGPFVVTSHQSPVASRQPRVASRESPVASLQSSVLSHGSQSESGSREPSGEVGSIPGFGLTTDD